MMYCFSPDHWFGSDKIVEVSGVSHALGTLLLADETLLLVLGTTIPRVELCSYRLNPVEIHVLHKQLLSQKTLDFALQFAEQRFAAYAQVLPLFLQEDCKELLHREDKKAKPLSRERVVVLESGQLKFKASASTQSQQLIVFPDLWTLTQQIPEKVFLQPGVVCLHATLSPVQQKKAFWAIKSGAVHTVLTTHAGIFQDRYYLERIVVIDAHKWRYKSSQEPRYWTPTVLEYMAQHYGARVEFN